MTTHPSTPHHTVVIGAGLSGLAASYDLIKKGFQVTLLDTAQTPGGLAGMIDIEGHPVDRFYHFICRLDYDLFHLIDELNLSGRLKWHKTRTSFFHEKKLYPFGTPFDLIRFQPIPWLQRIRFGVHILYSRYRLKWKWLDQIPAKPWLIENIGEKAYDVIWHPLLKVKFGDYHDKISAAWVWHRIWRVAKSRKLPWDPEVFGYLDEGSATLINGLIEWLCQQPNFTLRMGKPVQSIQIDGGQVTDVQVDGHIIPCDSVISTAALPQLTQMLPDLDDPYFDRLKKIEYIGVVCALFVLKKSFSPYFWMNINDQRISYNGVIEITNLNEHWKKSGLNLLYIPYYLRTDEPRFHYSDERLFQEYIQSLKTIRPDFSEDWIKEWHIFRSSYAQAICVTNFADLRPEPVTPVKGLYISDSTQFYPEDRTLSAAIRQGRLAAKEVCDRAS